MFGKGIAEKSVNVGEKEGCMTSEEMDEGGWYNLGSKAGSAQVMEWLGGKDVKLMEKRKKSLHLNWGEGGVRSRGREKAKGKTG